MKTWQISLIAIGAFALLALETLGAACFSAHRFISATRNLAIAERHQQVDLEYVRERLAAATLYKEAAERLSDRGDYNGVLLAETEYQRQLQRIDERYPTARRAH